MAKKQNKKLFPIQIYNHAPRNPNKVKKSLKVLLILGTIFLVLATLIYVLPYLPHNNHFATKENTTEISASLDYVEIRERYCMILTKEYSNQFLLRGITEEHANLLKELKTGDNVKIILFSSDVETMKDLPFQTIVALNSEKDIFTIKDYNSNLQKELKMARTATLIFGSIFNIISSVCFITLLIKLKNNKNKLIKNN